MLNVEAVYSSETLITICHTVCVILEVLCVVAAPCSASYDWTQITCVALVALLLLWWRCTACVMSVLFSCGLGKIRGSFSQTDMRTLTQFHVLLGKSDLVVEERFRDTILLHVKLFTDGWMLLKMARKSQMMPLTVEHQHRRWTYATWNKWNLSLNVCTVFNAWQFLQKSESLQQVFTISLPTAWGNKKFVWSRLHMWSTMKKSHVCSSFHHPYAALQKWRQCIRWSHFNGWWVMYTFSWPSVEMTECRMACSYITEAENSTIQSGCFLRHERHVYEPKESCTWPSHASLYNCQWPVLLHTLAGWSKQLELLEHDVILLQDNTMPYRHHYVQNLVQQWSWEVLAHLTLQISPLVITGCLHMWKNILW